MGLMDTLHKLMELCISIQESLSHLTDILERQVLFNKSMIDLAGIDAVALETNVKLLSSYAEEIDYIISKLTELSGNIQVLFWLIISIAILILAVVGYLIVSIIYENRDKIFNLIERKSKNVDS